MRRRNWVYIVALLVPALFVGIHRFGSTTLFASYADTAVRSTANVTCPDMSAECNGLWASGFETGDTSEWTLAGAGGLRRAPAGGIFNSGVASVVVDRELPRSGDYSVKMTIGTPPESGARLFRWHESQSNPALHYTVWMYIPRRYSISHFWNVMQWKSRVHAGQVDPFFVANVGNRPSGSMYLYLYDWQRRISYHQEMADIPVARWVRLDAFYHCDAQNGRVVLWQDGRRILERSGVPTSYYGGDCQWSINNYSDDLTPSPATLYFDDARITRAPLTQFEP